MKKRKQRHILIVWLLLICMLPLSVTKIVHRHGQQPTACCTEHHCDTDTDHSDHPINDDPCCCQICKFTLSPYLVAEVPHFTLYTHFISCEPVYNITPIYIEPVHSTLLRAPPQV